jgi:large subunit ribosomal protein L15
VKLHDLKPAPGSHTPKRRVGRGIASGQGKTAGRGTKGQKSRAGGNLPAWFEGGQTPLHQRIPKLRGFRNPFRVSYEIVNLGDIARLVELGVLEPGEMPGAKPKAGKAAAKTGSKAGAPVTVNQEILRAAGLVRTLDRPMKVLAGGELSTPLFVVADAFSAAARSKIEAAGGTASVIEVPAAKTKALGVAPAAEAEAPVAAGSPVEVATEAAAEPVAEPVADATPIGAAPEAAPEAALEAAPPAPAETVAPPAKPAPRRRKASASTEPADAGETETRAEPEL